MNTEQRKQNPKQGSLRSAPEGELTAPVTPKAGCSPVCFWDGGRDGKAGVEADFLRSPDAAGGKERGAAALGNNLAVSLKVKHIPTIQSSHPIPGIYRREKQIYVHTKILYLHVHSSLFVLTQSCLILFL